MKQPNPFPLDRIAEITANPENFALVERVPNLTNLFSHPILAGDELHLLFLDTETTGLDPASDRIIQLGMVAAKYSPSRNLITQLGGRFDAFEDPGVPISEFISDYTGITDADVAGQSLGDITAWFEADPIVIAHNALFDRPFFERRFPHLDNLRWACSFKEIDWPGLGYEGSGLGPLILQRGFFFRGHRAADDCEGLAFLLHQEQSAFVQLMDAALATSYVVEAWGSPFETKDRLKERRYRWDERRVWVADNVRDLEAELDFLDSLYPRARARAAVKTQTARQRYKRAGRPKLEVA